MVVMGGRPTFTGERGSISAKAGMKSIPGGSSVSDVKATLGEADNS